MIDEFLTNKTTPKYAYNLSLTFYNAFNVFANHDIKQMFNFHCILSLFRVRLNECPQKFELLDGEIRKSALS